MQVLKINFEEYTNLNINYRKKFSRSSFQLFSNQLVFQLTSTSNSSGPRDHPVFN